MRAFCSKATWQIKSNGSIGLDIAARTTGTLAAVLDVIITGSPDGSGGVVMQQSQASFGPPATPTEFRGQITGLDGSHMTMALANTRGSHIDLQVDVTISGTQVTGVLTSASTPTSDGGSNVAH